MKAIAVGKSLRIWKIMRAAAMPNGTSNILSPGLAVSLPEGGY